MGPGSFLSVDFAIFPRDGGRTQCVLTDFWARGRVLEGAFLNMSTKDSLELGEIREEDQIIITVIIKL